MTTLHSGNCRSSTKAEIQRTGPYHRIAMIYEAWAWLLSSNEFRLLTEPACAAPTETVGVCSSHYPKPHGPNPTGTLAHGPKRSVTGWLLLTRSGPEHENGNRR